MSILVNDFQSLEGRHYYSMITARRHWKEPSDVEVLKKIPCLTSIMVSIQTVLPRAFVLKFHTSKPMVYVLVFFFKFFFFFRYHLELLDVRQH